MTGTVQDRSHAEARTMLYRFLDHRKADLGLTADQGVKPEDFFPVDPQLLIELLGWTVQKVSMVGHTSSGEEFIAKCNKAEEKIVLLDRLSKEVERYTLAHELAHVLLHADIPDCNAGTILTRPLSMLSASEKKVRGTYSKIEREAEVFARELLMPERAVRHHFQLLFGCDQLRASSDLGRKFAPQANKEYPVDLRAAATEIATWSAPLVFSLVNFFGVSQRAMRGRLIGLYLVY